VEKLLRKYGLSEVATPREQDGNYKLLFCT